MPLAPETWTPLEKVEDRKIRYYAPIVAQEQKGSVLDDIPSKRYEVKSYSKLKHLINIHSWAPFFSLGENNLSFRVFSQDKLNTMFSSLGYEYNTRKKTSNVFLDLSYQGLYPIISLTARFNRLAAGAKANTSRMMCTSPGQPNSARSGSIFPLVKPIRLTRKGLAGRDNMAPT